MKALAAALVLSLPVYVLARQALYIVGQVRRELKLMYKEQQMAKPKKFNGLDPKTNALVFADGTQRSPGIDPDTKEYSTAQMMFDEEYGGDTAQPLFD